MKKVLLVVGFIVGLLFYPTLAMTKNAGEYIKEIESKFISSKTILHSSSSTFIDIENKSSQILIDTSDYGLDSIFVNEKFTNLAKKKCQEFDDMTFNGNKKLVRTLSPFRAKFYCLSLEEELLGKIESVEWFILQCKNEPKLKGDPACVREEENFNNLKLDLKDFKLKNKNKNLEKNEKDKEEALLASINKKRSLCTKIGFENETEGMANCILQLMSEENKEQQVVIVGNNSSSDGLASSMDDQNAIMNQQTLIMQKQLKLQRIQNSQKALKSFQYMMDFGKVPPLGYGY